MFKKIIVIIVSILIITSLAIINTTIINPNQITIRKQNITSDKINEKLDGFQIAYFSDLHYGTFIDDDYLNRVIEKINMFKPDLILFGGDLIDSYINNPLSDNQRENLINALKTLNASHGKYAVFGNHDVSSQNVKQDIINILSEANFEILDNENVIISKDINNYFNLIGIDSVSSNVSSLDDNFYTINSNHFTLCLTHFPDTFDQMLSYDFDYLLAGHSHGGQVYIPIISLFNRELGCHNYFHGKYTKNNKTLDITNGVGMTRHKARLFADNEIVIYQLKTNTTK